MKKILSANQFPVVVSAACLFFTGCSVKPLIYMRDPQFELADMGKRILCIPIDSIAVEYVDRTQTTPDTMFSDSFFLEAANSLVMFEASKLFTSSELPEDGSTDSLFSQLRTLRFSRITLDTTHAGTVSETIKLIAEQTGSDLVLIPYSIKIKHVLYQPQGWRGESPSYQKPITFKAFGTVHIQIWNNQGTLLYEKSGRSDAGRPIMYSLFGKKKTNQDIIKFAKHIYAPPLVRALYMAIQESLRMAR